MTLNSQLNFRKRPDPLTHQNPRFVRELTGFDKPTTFSMTVEENQKENDRVFNRRLNNLAHKPYLQ